MGALAVPVPVRGSQASQKLEKRIAGIYPTGAQDLDYRIAHIYYIESIDPSSALPNGTHLGTGAIAYAETRVCDGASGQRQVGAAVTAGAALNDAQKGAVAGAVAGRGPLFDTRALSANALLSPCSI